MFQHGAVNGVMGSHHQLQMGTLSNLLIDGGLFQGNERTVSGVIGALHPRKLCTCRYQSADAYPCPR